MVNLLKQHNSQKWSQFLLWLFAKNYKVSLVLFTVSQLGTQVTSFSQCIDMVKVKINSRQKQP